MRRVDRESELEAALRDASSEAERAFRTAESLCRAAGRALASHRNPATRRPARQHDSPGRTRVLHPTAASEGDRGVPFAPVSMHPEMRHEMGQAAIRAACARGLLQRGHGGIPGGRGPALLLPGDEHPPAGGASRNRAGHGARSGPSADRNRCRRGACRSRRKQIAWRGSAIECRIYAEDPYNHFLPYPGKITRLTRPLGPGIRLDGCVYVGLDGADGIRSAARQARRVGRHTRCRDSPACSARSANTMSAAYEPTSRSFGRFWRTRSSAPRICIRGSSMNSSSGGAPRALERSRRGRCPGWRPAHGRGEGLWRPTAGGIGQRLADRG